MGPPRGMSCSSIITSFFCFPFISLQLRSLWFLTSWQYLLSSKPFKFVCTCCSKIPQGVLRFTNSYSVIRVMTCDIHRIVKSLHWLTNCWSSYPDITRIFFLMRTLSPFLIMENVFQRRYNGPNSFLQSDQCNYFLPLTKRSGTSVDEMRKPELDCFPKASTVLPSWHSIHVPKESRLQGNGNLRTHHGDSQLNIVTFSLTVCVEAATGRKCCYFQHLLRQEA